MVLVSARIGAGRKRLHLRAILVGSDGGMLKARPRLIAIVGMQMSCTVSPMMLMTTTVGEAPSGGGIGAHARTHVSACRHGTGTKTIRCMMMSRFVHREDPGTMVIIAVGNMAAGYVKCAVAQRYSWHICGPLTNHLCVASFSAYPQTYKACCCCHYVTCGDQVKVC